MRSMVIRDLERPDEVVDFPMGRTEAVTVGSMVVGRNVHQPGWHWAEHVKPVVGTEWCEFRHVAYVVSGRGGFRMKDGRQYEAGPGNVFDVPPGHDGWVIGDEPFVTIDWMGSAGWATPPSAGERIVRTLLFTDIVESTAFARRLGDQVWNRLLGSHNEAVRVALQAHRGHEVNTTGDGFLAAFDGAGNAVGAAIEIRAAVAELGLRIRCGIHTGEVEVVRDDVRGVAVHETARIMALAAPGEILVSGLTHELAAGGGASFEDRGTHQLRGVETVRQLYAVVG